MSNDNLNQVLNNLLQGVIIYEPVFDANGTLTDFTHIFVNQPGLDILAMPRSQVVGKTLLDAFPYTASNGLWQKYKTVYESAQRQRFEIAYPFPNKTVWFNVGVARIDDTLLVTYDDITPAHQQAENLSTAKKKLEAIFNNTTQLTCMLSPEGHIVEINRPTLAFLQVGNTTLAGTLFWQLEALVQQGMQEKVKDAIEKAGKGENSRFILPVVMPAGKTMYLDFIVKPVRKHGGAIEMIIVEGRDISTQIENHEKLKRSEELFEEAQRLAHIGSFDCDLATFNMEWSNELYRIYDYEPGAIKPDVSMYTHLDHKDTPYIQEEVLARIAESDSFIRDRKIVTATGRIKHVHTRAIVVRDETGKPIRLYGSTQDMTEQVEQTNQVTASSARYRDLAKNIPDAAVLMFNKDLVCEVAEGPELAKLNLCKKELEGAPVTAAFNVFEKDTEIATMLKAAIEGNTNELDIQLGSSHYTISAFPIQAGGKVVNGMAKIKNVTRLANYQHRLEQNIEELNRSNHELEQFAYVASHDLQEPLRKIQTFGNRLMQRHAEGLDEEGADYLRRMQNAASRMQELIANLLDFSRVSRKEKQFSQVNLEQVVQNVLQDQEEVIAQTQAAVTLKNLPQIEGDEKQLARLFQNLVSNAIKFRKPGIQPQISITAQPATPAHFNEMGIRQQEGYILVTVQDNGIGFDNKYAEKIFTIFQRLHGRSEYEGTGIGLAVCRKVAENHKGFIKAYSQPNEGSIFLILLPQKQVINEQN